MGCGACLAAPAGLTLAAFRFAGEVSVPPPGLRPSTGRFASLCGHFLENFMSQRPSTRHWETIQAIAAIACFALIGVLLAL